MSLQWLSDFSGRAMSVARREASGMQLSGRETGEGKMEATFRSVPVNPIFKS